MEVRRCSAARVSFRSNCRLPIAEPECGSATDGERGAARTLAFRADRIRFGWSHRTTRPAQWPGTKPRRPEFPVATPETVVCHALHKTIQALLSDATGGPDICHFRLAGDRGGSRGVRSLHGAARRECLPDPAHCLCRPAVGQLASRCLAGLPVAGYKTTRRCAVAGGNSASARRPRAHFILSCVQISV